MAARLQSIAGSEMCQCLNFDTVQSYPSCKEFVLDHKKWKLFMEVLQWKHIFKHGPFLNTTFLMLYKEIQTSYLLKTLEL